MISTHAIKTGIFFNSPNSQMYILDKIFLTQSFLDDIIALVM